MAAKPNPFNKFINLLVVLVLGYAIAKTYFFPSPVTHPKGSGALYEEKPHAPLAMDDWSKLIGVIGTAMQPVLNVVSETKGTGSPVVCGQQVTYRYTDKAVGEDTVFTADKTASFRLGSEPIIEGHLRALADMNVGGKAVVQFSSHWGYRDTGPAAARGADIESHIELISAVPAAPEVSMPYRVFYKLPHSPAAETFACGQTLKAKLTFWTLGGEQLFPQGKKEPEFMPLTLGLGQAPLGVETVLQKISPGESVTAILPPGLLGFFHSGDAPGETEKQLRGIAFPKNQAIIVDIEAAEAISTADGAAAPAAAPADAKEAAPKP